MARTGSRGPSSRRSTRSIRRRPSRAKRYADHFFCWLYDFNGDGRNDIFDGRLSRHAGLRLREPRARRLRQALAATPGARLGLQRVAAVARPGRRRAAGAGLHARRLLRLCHDRLGQAARAVDVSQHFRAERAQAVRPWAGRGRHQRRRPPRHHHQGRLVRAAGRARAATRSGSFTRPTSPGRAAPRCTPTTSTATATTT